MIRKIFTPSSGQVTFLIPEKYVGTELEIIIFPVKDISSASDFLQNTQVFGYAKGKLRMADDFDAPLDDFMEYMPIVTADTNIQKYSVTYIWQRL